MSNQPMICDACQREIKRGEEYIAFTRQREVLRRGVVKVVNATLTAVYHPACEPAKGRA